MAESPKLPEAKPSAREGRGPDATSLAELGLNLLNLLVLTATLSLRERARKNRTAASPAPTPGRAQASSGAVRAPTLAPASRSPSKVESIAPDKDQAPAGSLPEQGRYLLNLLLLVATGILLSAWTLYYTDLFPLVGGLLGLGGLFAWIAFLSHLITEERKQRMQQSFESRVLLNRQTTLLLPLVLGAFFLAAGSCGTVEISATPDAANRHAQVFRAAGGQSITHPVRRGLLPARGRKRFLLSTAWFQAADFRIKLSGLPALTVRVQPLRKQSVVVPDSFLLQPVLLVRTAASISATAHNNPGFYSLRVERRHPETEQTEELFEIESYRGETVWVGCDEDVAIPQRVLDRWKLELPREKAIPEAITRWRSPWAPARPIRLQPNDVVSVTLLRGDKPETLTSIEVEMITRLLDFPQEVLLDV